MNVIDRAIEVLHERGWWQHGQAHAPGEAVCALLALDAAAGESHLAFREFRRACDLILDEVSETRSLNGIALWNDDPTTSFEDVLLVMKRASARLDEAEGRA